MKLQNPFLNIADLCGFSREDLPAGQEGSGTGVDGDVEPDVPVVAPLSEPEGPASGAGPGASWEQGETGGACDCDQDVFLQAMEDVRPLSGPAVVYRDAGSERSQARTAPLPVDGVIGEAEWVMARLAELVAGEGVLDVTFSGEYVEESKGHLNPRILDRLRTGQLSMQAWLDLHGLDRWEAKWRVTEFLEDSVRKGFRCVLIVHGRGLHSPDGVPVLKESLSGWLRGGRPDWQAGVRLLLGPAP